jgi:parvulin-like peptidyl-prolyl isomerase
MFIKIISLIVAATATLQAAEILGKIGEVEVTTTEVKSLVDSINAGSETTAPLNSEALDQLVRALLVQRLVLKQAITTKHNQKPEVIEQLRRTQEAALAESYLREQSQPAADYPSQEELAAAYNENKDAFKLPKSWLLSQIYIADTKHGEAAETKKRLDVILKQLDTPGADFKSIARVNSDDRSSAAQGGELGWLQENLIQPSIREVLPSLKLNQVSKPIRMEGGWHIIKFLDTREETTPTLEQITPQLKNRLRSLKAQENREKFLASLIEKNPPAINGIELQKLQSNPQQ